MTHSIFTQTDSKNRKIFFQKWMPAKPLSGIIALIHGLGEHSGRYEHVAEYFGRHGFGMVAMDTYGHGKTEGKHGHADSMEAYMNQISGLLKLAKEEAPGQHVFLYGHSMGGNLVLNYLFRHQPGISGVIASAPAVRPGFSPSKLLLAIGRIGRVIAPSLTQPNSLDLNNLSHDHEVIEKYKSDPLVHNQVSGVVGLGIIEWGEWLLKNARQTPVPLLIMHGSEDQLTHYESSREFASLLSGDVTFKSWDGFYHEIHNEFEKEQVFDYTMDWIRDHSGSETV